MSSDELVKPKSFIVVPFDAFQMLDRRASSMAAAEELAREAIDGDRQTHFVLKLVAVASIEGPPVKFRKL